MRTRLIPALLAVCLLLPACTTKSTTHSTVQDASGNVIHSESASTSTNEAAETAAKIGTSIKEGVVSGYEWTKDKTVKGYNWVKEKATGSASPDNATETEAAPLQ